MATYTPNLNLKKPSTGEYYDMVADLNDTKDKIDTAVNKTVKNVKNHGAIGDGLTNDTVAIQALIDASANGDLIYFPSGVYLTDPIIFTGKSINVEGHRATLKAISNNAHRLLNYDQVSDIKISGIKFDMNLKGRTALYISNGRNIIVENCEFTGYSSAFGHDNQDAGIHVNGCINGTLRNNIFEDWGQIYTAAGPYVRCMSLAGAVDFIVHGNTFKRINQGIVSAFGPNLAISNNFFSGVSDNAIYLVDGCTGATISSNIFKDCQDEGVVIGAENCNITGNLFRNIANKHISITSSGSHNLHISGNTFECTNPLSSEWMIATRVDITDNCNNVHIANNNFLHAGTPYAIIYIAYTTNLHIIGNTIKMSVSTHGINLYGDTNKNFVIENNLIDNTGGVATALGIKSESITGAGLIKSNVMFNCRGAKSSANTLIEGQSIRPTLGYFGTPSNSMMTSDEVPTVGTFLKGDVAFSTVPAAAGFVGWVCTVAGSPGTWKGFGLIQA